MVTLDSAGNTMEWNTVKEQIGVSTKPLIPGSRTGPPADREYPVDPVCVEIINLTN